MIVAHKSLGWLPCIPLAYSPMNGEPIAQCNSISDQSPCGADGSGPYAFSGYCPSVMPGYPGLWGGGMAGLGDQILPAIADIAGSQMKCTVASGPNAGAQIDCPDVTSIDVVDTAPASTDWNKWFLIGGLVLGGVVLMGAMRR